MVGLAGMVVVGLAGMVVIGWPVSLKTRSTLIVCITFFFTVVHSECGSCSVH